jgi:hypothetical protein
MKLTKGEAVGQSRMAKSSSVKGSLGTDHVLNGNRSRIMMGNPIAAAGRDAVTERVEGQICTPLV